MLTAETKVGASGKLRCTLEVVSQNFLENSSRIRLISEIRLISGGPAADTTGNCESFYGYDVVTPVKLITFSNLYTSWFEVDRVELDFLHMPDGYANIAVQYFFGPTITEALGAGGSIMVYGVLPAIPTKPTKPSSMTVFYEDPQYVRVNWEDSWQSSWDPIQVYELVVFDRLYPGSPQTVSMGADIRETFVQVPKSSLGHTFRLRSKNNAGYSEVYEVTTSTTDLPEKAKILSAYFETESRINIIYEAGRATSFLSEASHSDIFAYDTAVVETPDTTCSFDSFTLGEHLYVRVRGRNSFGFGDFSKVQTIPALFGPAIKVGSSWRKSTTHVFTDGSWKLAEAYIYVNANWRQISY